MIDFDTATDKRTKNAPRDSLQWNSARLNIICEHIFASLLVALFSRNGFITLIIVSLLAGSVALHFIR